MILLQKYYRLRYKRNRLFKRAIMVCSSNMFNPRIIESKELEKSKPKSHVGARRRVVCSAASPKESFPHEPLIIQKVDPICDGNTLEDALGKYVNMSASIRDKYLHEHIVPEYLVPLRFKNPRRLKKIVELICRVREDRKKEDYIETSIIIDLDEFFRKNPEVNLTKNYVPFTTPAPLPPGALTSYLAGSRFDPPMFSKPPSNPSDYFPFVAMIIDTSTGLRITVESKGISRYQEGHLYVQGSGNHYIWYQDQKLTINQYIKAIASIWPRFLVDFKANPEGFKFYILKIGSLWVSDKKRLSYVEACNTKDGPLSYVYHINSIEDQFNVNQARELCLLKGHSVISLVSPVHIGSYELKGSRFPGKQFDSILQASAQTNLCVYTIIYRVFSKDYDNWYLIQDLDNINQNMAELETAIEEKKIKEINEQKLTWYNHIKTSFYLTIFMGYFLIAAQCKAMHSKQVTSSISITFSSAPGLVIDRPSTLRGNIAGTSLANNRLLQNTQAQMPILNQATRTTQNAVVSTGPNNFVVNPTYEPDIQGSKSESFQKQSDALTKLALPETETEWQSATDQMFEALSSSNTRSHPIVSEFALTEYEELLSEGQPSTKRFETFTFFDTHSYPKPIVSEYVIREYEERSRLQSTVPQTEIVASSDYDSETINKLNLKPTYRSILNGKTKPMYGFDQQHPGVAEISTIDRPCPPVRLLNVNLDVHPSVKRFTEDEVPRGLEVETNLANYPSIHQVTSQLAAVANLYVLQRKDNAETKQKKLREASEMLDNIEKQGENNPQNAILIATDLLKQAIALFEVNPVVKLYETYPPDAKENMAIRNWWLSKYSPLKDCTGAGVYVIVLCVASANPFIYIGETNNLIRRGKEYAEGARANNTHSRILKELIQKYGIQNFAFVKIRGTVSIKPGMTAWALNFVEEANRYSPDWNDPATRIAAETELIHFNSQLCMPHEGIDCAMAVNLNETQSPHTKFSTAQAKANNQNSEYKDLFIDSVNGVSFKDSLNNLIAKSPSPSSSSSSSSSSSLKKDKTLKKNKTAIDQTVKTKTIRAASEPSKIVSDQTLKKNKTAIDQTVKTKTIRAASEPNKKVGWNKSTKINKSI